MDREDWNRRYAGRELLWTAEPNRFLVEELATLPPGRALDLACGEGRNAIWLAGRGFTVDAVDFSDVALEKARALAAGRGVQVRWIEADVESFDPRQAAYDLVILFYLHLPWDRMKPMLRRAAAAVAAGGTFLLVGHDLENLTRGHGGPQSPEVLYTPRQVAGQLDRLDLVTAARRERPVDTGEESGVAIDCLVRARAPAAEATAEA
jgi:SAM-dependent methyltransferase